MTDVSCGKVPRHHVLRSARRMSFLEAIVELAVGRCVVGGRDIYRRLAEWRLME